MWIAENYFLLEDIICENYSSVSLLPGSEAYEFIKFIDFLDYIPPILVRQ